MNLIIAKNKCKEFILQNTKASVGISLVSLIILLAVLAPILTPYSPLERIGASHQKPSSEHILGTTQLGRDVWSQTIYGGRISLMVGFTAGLIVMLMAMIIGITAGYFGGWIDNAISTIINIVMVIPNIPLLLIMAALIGKISPFAIASIIGLTSWAWGARVIRAQTMSVRNRDFVHAAEVLGENKFRLLFFEVMPNMLAILSSAFVGTIIYAITAATTLEFIGFGDPLAVSWGIMLYNAQNSAAIRIGAWWELLGPTMCLVVFGSGLALINFSIDEISNPKLKAQKIMGKYKREMKKMEKFKARAKQ